MVKSQLNIALLDLIRKGYRIDESGILRNPSGDQLKGSKSKTGYLCFCFRNKGKINMIPFHKIQAFQKYGDLAFEENIKVRHKNGVSTDNSWKNILIGSHSDNMMDIPDQIRMSKSLHATSFVRKHNKEEIKVFHSESKSYSKTMEKFGISSKGTLNYILKS